ncbi:MAG: hypothetical protein J6L83_06005 [Clostridia bacterium]|nr:hypothetical protein [Clostridia bacterium]
MLYTLKKQIENSIKVYESPSVTVIDFICGDIITESHLDPDMGEWDTE